MKSASTTAALAAIVTLSMPAFAQAQDASFEYSFNAAVTTDYVWRGFSQSDRHAAVQGGADISYGNFYGGTWASSVDFSDSTDAEWDFYAGYAGSAGAIDYDLAVTYYTYVNAPSGADYNFVEFKAAASYTIDAFTVGAAVNYSNDFYGADKHATYVELTGEYAINDRWAVSGGFGRQFLDVTGDYNAWNLGAGVNLNEVVSLDLRYWDSGVKGSLSDARVVATIGVAF